MASTSKNGSRSEKGHAKNAANFEQLTAYCASLGTVYNPSKEALKLVSLQALLTSYLLLQFAFSYSTLIRL